MVEIPVRVIVTAVDRTNEAFKNISKNASKLNSDLTKSTAVSGNLAKVIGYAIGAISVVALGKLAYSAGMTTARVQELDLAAKVIGKNMGISAKEIDETVNSVRKLNITSQVATSLTIELMRANISLTEATKLTRAAQDLAVVSGKSSSETLQMITETIQTGIPIRLRAIGINQTQTQIEEEYAQSIGKTVKQLTEQDKKQAIISVIMREASKFTGLYELSLSGARKAMGSFGDRVTMIQEELGNVFLPTLNLIIPAMNKAATAVRNWLIDNQETVRNIGNNIALFVLKMGYAAKATVEAFKAIVVAGGIVALSFYATRVAVLAFSSATWTTLLPAIGKVIAALAAQAGAALAAGAAMMLALGPVGFLGLAVGGIGVIAAYKSNFLQLRSSIENTARSLKNVFAASIDDVKFKIPEIPDAFNEGMDEMTGSATKAAEKIKKELEKEIEDFTRDLAKMTKNYERSLKDLVISHTKKTKDVRKQLDDENKDFNQSSKERKESYDEEMGDMKMEHERKVDDIKEQIDEETAKGIEADAKRLADFKKTLDREVADFDKAVAKKKKGYEAETAKAIEEHAKRLLVLQEELNTELELQKKYGDDFARYKDEQAADDITRLKEAFKEEMDERKRQHETKLEELKAQGLAERAVSEATKKGEETRAGEIIQKEISKPVKKAGWKSQSTGEIRYEGGPIPWPVAIMADGRTKYSDGSIGWGKWDFGYYQKGGIVSGRIGQPQLAVVHGGERIMPAISGQSRGGETNITFNFSGTFLGSQNEMRVYAMKIWESLGQVAASQNKSPSELLNLRI